MNNSQIEFADCPSDNGPLNNYINKNLIYEYIRLALNELLLKLYSKPTDGIPKNDLSLDIITILDKANTAVQPDEINSLVELDKLAKVAFSGNYKDLQNVPQEYTVDNRLDLNSINPIQNSIVTRELNSLDRRVNSNSSNLMTVTRTLLSKASISLVPTKVSLLENDASFISYGALARVASTGDYNDLTNKPLNGNSTTIDQVLNTTSENPVSNKVITKAINLKADLSYVLSGLSNILSSLNNKVNLSDLNNLLLQKQDKLTANTVIGNINGQQLKFGGNIYITGTGGSGENQLRGRGTYESARTYADTHSTEIFQWLLEDYDDENNLVRKIIWHITEPDIFIDAIGVIIQ